MLNPIEIIKMQQEAKKMQNRLREKKISGESKDGLLVLYMNGAQEFEDIYIDDILLDPSQFDKLKNCMKEAFKDFQKNLQKSMASDMSIDDLKNMLG